MGLNPEEIRSIFRRTVIVRKPTYGIVRGDHELPYICLGPSFESGYEATTVSGKVQVSRRFVIRPSHYAPSYEEVFGSDNVDLEISGRVFGFLGFPERPVDCKSEYLTIEHRNESVDSLLSRCLDDLERREDITTGVLISPDNRYFPISVERFISSVLDDEFSF
ncbi:MAG: hypothetical protein KF886_17275 [Candidatus Hydrogenedentes bacterium]|nr:hypothetical protein [Candidatus Hydrogenedentota bacterium]